ncbi:MAG: MerR family transcriptional regulator [Cellulosilyticaceae bacterium]
MGDTIGKVAERVGLSAHTLRYYEKEGLLPHVKKNEQGIRSYEEDDIIWIELIKCLKETGMSIGEIQQIVTLSLAGEGTIPERKTILENHKVKLQEQMAALHRSIAKIDKKLDWYNGKNTDC